MSYKINSLLIVLFAILFNFNIFAAQKAQKTIVIYDIDDTIKTTHIGNFSDKTKYAFFTDNLFAGSNILLNYMVKEFGGNDKLSYVTNAPEWLMKKYHTEFIKGNNFPNSSIYFKVGQNHKVNTITKLIIAANPSRVVLVGDNGEKDIEYYHQITQKFAQSGIQFLQFIHTVYKTDGNKFLALYPDQVAFATPLEILFEIYFARAVDNNTEFYKTAHDIAAELLAHVSSSDGHGPQAIPKWVDCRDLRWNPQWSQLLSNIPEKRDVFQLILDRCLSPKN